MSYVISNFLRVIIIITDSPDGVPEFTYETQQPPSLLCVIVSQFAIGSYWTHCQYATWMRATVTKTPLAFDT